MNDSGKILDGLLVLQHRSGSKKALGLLVKKYHEKLCKHSYWYTKDIDASKDVVQDCWRIILSKINTLKDPNLFGSWAFRIVTRKSLDHANKKYKESERLQAYYANNNSMDTSEDQEVAVEKLSKTIQLLPENQQMVLRLFYTENYSLKEISTILGVSVGTVKSRLFHSREKLKTILKK
ncbi:RNA polymerase sigma factor [Maribacter sp. 2210JD10-5]|uniref:RNA polymerase sigma factor n=1 Tax=Maribacter sp. 2210JD10-5 TaxID=3386272 RepID=UPI0039BD8591